jgi:hypothetical protein
MMKKVLFTLVLLMAALVVNAQASKTMTKKELVNDIGDYHAPPPPPKTETKPSSMHRLLPGANGGPSYVLVIRRRPKGVAKMMSQGATKMPQNEGVSTTITATELPKLITDNIANDFVGYTIKDVTKVVKDKVLSYEVNITKEKDAKTLVYEEQPAPK